MKTRINSNSRGLTIIEVVLIITGLALLAGLVVLPRLARARPRSTRFNCQNNLHQVALAFKTWALDNQDRYSMQVPSADGGAREDALRGNAARAFVVMSNELNTPKILLCPLDVKRSGITSFGSRLYNSNISYFISVDATDSIPQMFLAGDRNLETNGVPLRGGAMHRMVPTSTVGWTRELHNRAGHILLVDGSSQDWTNAALQSAVATGMNTNRIDVP